MRKQSLNWGVLDEGGSLTWIFEGKGLWESSL